MTERWKYSPPSESSRRGVHDWDLWYIDDGGILSEDDDARIYKDGRRYRIQVKRTVLSVSVTLHATVKELEEAKAVAEAVFDALGAAAPSITVEVQDMSRRLRAVTGDKDGDQ